MRTLVNYWPTKKLSANLWDDFDNIFDGLVTERDLSPNLSDVRFAPLTDITENETSYNLSIDLPGIKKEDIKIEMHEGTLVVSGERKSTFEETKDKLQRYEKTYGFFKRSFTLPKMTDGEKIQARHENGVLEINIPKAVAATAKKIEIE